MSLYESLNKSLLKMMEDAESPKRSKISRLPKNVHYEICDDLGVQDNWIIYCHHNLWPKETGYMEAIGVDIFYDDRRNLWLAETIDDAPIRGVGPTIADAVVALQQKAKNTFVDDYETIDIAIDDSKVDYSASSDTDASFNAMLFCIKDDWWDPYQK